MSYDNFADTFSNSRKNHPWPELDYIIEDIREQGFSSVLDIGCGNGRFLEEIQNSRFKIQNYLGIDSSK
jgi:2-polyprenyl-3-methyl-5-hydroxy-6-metoxy-1,4-benzoquinol methylase